MEILLKVLSHFAPAVLPEMRRCEDIAVRLLFVRDMILI